MTRPRQKITECEALKLVLEHLNETPRAVAKPAAEGAPDFVITLANGDAVGAEVTETANQAFAHGHDAFKRLAEALTGRLAVPVRVSLQSTESFVVRLRDEDPEPILRALLGLVHDHVGKQRAQTTYRGDELRRHGVKLMLSVVVAPFSKPFVLPRVSRIDFRLTEHVQAQVDKKTPKLAAYKRHAPNAVEWWLVLLGGERLDSAEPVEHVRRAAVRTPFDRVFFVDRSTRNVVAVRIAP